ncbi:MAG: GNAT family N-acetyltransferase [Bacilli bacterium]|nr:GNAT family N-acetyltransferase [Bacilli bacterium]
MRKIVVATEKDMPALLKCFRRVQGALESNQDFHYSNGYPSEDSFRKEMSDHTLYIVKDGARVIGMFGIEHNVTDYFCPKTHSQKKTYDLLDLVDNQGEKVTIINCFMVDPSFWGKGISNDMTMFIKSKYKHSSFLFAVFGDDEHSRLFWKKQGFRDYGVYEEQEWSLPPSGKKCIIMGRPLEKVGLCTGNW